MTGMDAGGDRPRLSTDLRDAAQAGDLVLVEYLLAGGASVDEGDEEGWTALMWGAPFPDVTEALLAAGADANHLASEGESALMAFARRGTPETVRMLLSAGARADYTDDTGDNALMEAAFAGNVGTMAVLVEAGTDPNARTISGETALFAAVREGEWEAARLLLEMGTDPLIEVRSGPRAGETALGRPEGEEEPVAWALKEVERRAREVAPLQGRYAAFSKKRFEAADRAQRKDLCDELEAAVHENLRAVLGGAFGAVIADLRDAGHNIEPELPWEPGEFTYAESSGSKTHLRFAFDVVISTGYRDRPITSEQDLVCRRFGAPVAPVADDMKVGVARNVRDGLLPLNGLRHPVVGDTSGWYIWAGEELSEDPDFFVPLHVEHLAEWCPGALPYLALPPGWRFLVAPGQEEVWRDDALLADRR